MDNNGSKFCPDRDSSCAGKKEIISCSEKWILFFRKFASKYTVQKKRKLKVLSVI